MQLGEQDSKSGERVAACEDHSELAGENAALKSQVVELSEGNSALTLQVAELREQHRSLSDELAALRAQVELLPDAGSSLLSQAGQNAEMGDAETSGCAVPEELATLKAQLGAMADENRDLRVQAALLEDRGQGLERVVEMTRDELREKQESVTQAEETIRRLMREQEELRFRPAPAQAQLQDAIVEITRLLEETSTLKKERDRLLIMQGDLLKQKDLLQKNVSTLQERLAGVDVEQVKRLETQIAQNDKFRDKLLIRVKEQTAEIQRLKALQSEVDDLKTKNAQLVTKVKDLSIQLLEQAETAK
jgi:chromosome segregation ATPase